MQEIKNTIFFLVGLLLGLLLALLLPALIYLYLLAAPYTKAEESFNLQATHDIVVHVVHGTPLFGAAAYHLRASYVHFTFPGTVPRTFTGAFLLAAVSKESFDVSGELDGQRIVRGFLGFANAFALFLYSCALSNAFGFGVGNWYTLLQASQFHVLFYASRTLPNTFAFGLTTLAATALVPVPQTWSPDARARAQKYAIYFLVTAGVVFRAEIALLLGTQVLFLLGMRQASLRNVVVAGATGAAIALAVSVPLDSYFWQRLVWPEFSSFVFNAVHGMSAEWGVSPWHTYFSSFLPKLLLNPLALPLIAAALYIPATSHAARALVIPQLAFIALYSLQPHKEARFIIYTIPPLTAAAALAASYIWTRRARTLLYRLGSLALVAALGASFLASVGMVVVSALNYPGGEALWALHQHVARAGIKGIVAVHMDVLSCMTGVSRFQQDHPSPPIWRVFSALPEPVDVYWWYDNTEDEEKLLDVLFWEQFHYVLAEDPGKVIGKWKVVETIYGFAGMELLRPDEGRMKGWHDEMWGLLMWRAGRGSAGGDGWRRWVWAMLVEEVGTYGVLREAARQFVTRGWWVEPRMEAKIHILKRKC